MKQQQSITNYLVQPFSTNDKTRFEQLLLHMIISNNLPFTFLENQETKSLFEFLSLFLLNYKSFLLLVRKIYFFFLEKNALK